MPQPKGKKVKKNVEPELSVDCLLYTSILYNNYFYQLEKTTKLWLRQNPIYIINVIKNEKKKP